MINGRLLRDSKIFVNLRLKLYRRSAWLYFNHGRVLERRMDLVSDSGEEQRMFVLDAVLEPLLPISARNATFSQDVTAGKLLEKYGTCYIPLLTDCLT